MAPEASAVTPSSRQEGREVGEGRGITGPYLSSALSGQLLLPTPTDDV